MHAHTKLNRRNSTEINSNTQVATILSHRSYYFSHMSRAAPRGTSHAANLFHRFPSAPTGPVVLHSNTTSPSESTIFSQSGLQSLLSGSPFQTKAACHHGDTWRDAKYQTK